MQTFAARSSAPVNSRRSVRPAPSAPARSSADAHLSTHPAPLSYHFGAIPIHPPAPPVAIHTDASAATAARALGADAFAEANGVYFAADRYHPETTAGRRLLFHELAHVAQQRNPGATASTEALEREADQVTADRTAGRTPGIHLAASAGRPLLKATNWKSGDVLLNHEAEDQVKNKGGLFSGNDQAHITVSSRYKLAYDTGNTTPQDNFRWSKLKDIVDQGHVKINAVPADSTFKARPLAGRAPMDMSINTIRAMGDVTVQGITLRVGDLSPDPTYDFIYYDKDQGIGALTHELFGHDWLALKSVPSIHPPAGSAAEKSKGTLQPAHGIKDPFGLIYSGTVRAYIAKYIESLASSTTVRTAAGGQVSVPKSPTQMAGTAFVVQAFNDIYTQAASGLKGKKYTAPIAQAWRILCNNYDVMQKNADALAAGNLNLFFTQEVLVYACLLLFRTWNQDQQDSFRELLADYSMSRAGFAPNELTNKVQALVGMAKSPFSPGSGISP
jgi:hypothetical protein